MHRYGKSTAIDFGGLSQTGSIALRNEDVGKETATRLQLHFAIVVLGTFLAALVLRSVYVWFAAPATVDPLILIARHRLNLNPKPVERFTFLVLMFVVPLATYGSVLKLDRTRFNQISPSMRFASSALPILLSLAFFWPFVGLDFGRTLISGDSMSPENAVWLLASCLIFSAVWFASISIRGRYQVGRNCTTSLAAVLFIATMLLQIGAWRVVGEASITVDAQWWNSADAVIYTVGQVVAGKTVLVDMPSQYGLFAEFVAPFFRVIGLSILSFTTLWAALQVLSLGAVFYVAQKHIREPALKITVGIALVMVTFETSLWFIGIPERYWQYWPIRFTWPALSVLAFHAYTRKKLLSRMFLISVIGAIGSIWNLDSGLVIELALSAFILGKFGFLRVARPIKSRRERRELMIALLLHIAAFAVAVTAMSVYLTTKSHHALNWAWLFEYQRTFYGAGFMMLPMPMKPSPWMAIIALYVLGIMVAVYSWMATPKARVSDLVFYLSFLGLGLFVYYEGRSHILNLITVCWPAVVLAPILSDRVVRAYRAELLPRVQLLLPVITLALLLYCSIPVLRHAKDLWTESIANFQTRGLSSDALVAGELRFIRAHSTPGEECLILAKRQGLYSAATGLASPVQGPGYAELITTRDRDLLLTQMARLKAPCVFVGIGKDTAVELDMDPVSILKQYAVQAESPDGTMLFLRPRM
jgi:hypothetical protein